MKTKKIAISAILAATMLAFGGGALATCPANTTVSGSTANLVGQVTDDGGDSNLTVWFQYGTTQSLGTETSHQSQYGIGSFCTNIYNLNPCQTYYYRAVAQNSVGTAYGDPVQSFATQCLPVTVDLKANNSNGPITVNAKTSITLSWTSTNGASCQASGDWSGSKATQGSETIQLSQVKTYNFILTCSNSSQTQSSQDSVTVISRAQAPTVITLPAIVTL